MSRGCRPRQVPVCRGGRVRGGVWRWVDEEMVCGCANQTAPPPEVDDADPALTVH